LDRRGPAGENQEPVATSVAGQVDQDVDVVPANQLGGLRVRQTDE
jgi:hypothetical protein